MPQQGYVDTTTNKVYSTPSKAKKKTQKKKMMGLLNEFLGTNGSPYDPLAATPTYGPGTGVLYGRTGTYNPLANSSVTNANSTVNDRRSTTQPISPGDGSGSGGGSGGGTGGNDQQVNWDPMTGFAANYTNAGMPILYDDPRVLVRDTLKGMGYNANDGLMDLLGKQANDLQYLAMLGLGGTEGSANSQTNENYINFANEWAKNMVTPGAGGFNYDQMIQTILDAPEGSAIKAALEGGTPQEQANILNNLVGALAGQTMTPLMQRAMGNVMQDRTDDWLSNKARGNEGMLADWLQKGGRGITG